MHLICAVDRITLAMPVAAVVRALPMVAFTPLPETPDFVIGAINLGGSPLPLIDMRRYMFYKEAVPAPDDKILVIDLVGRQVGIVVDTTSGVQAIDPAAILSAEAIAPGARRLSAIGAASVELMLIYDPATFLSGDEQARIVAALEKFGP
ncbi:chemotaxis protein CheW [Oceanibaculum pacificum]|uniref:CheW-like domain-containing protein n=1 Tax=Oceanibaculum pacificum TaxID=580166 RepID=A0A154VY77_9PROT|nr:chemotaxis protein CheW [Oceanibaculum pacificum]KZD06200.1 hypothetical protein AUP43_11180 [Oceanibaculum pacificum]